MPPRVVLIHQPHVHKKLLSVAHYAHFDLCPCCVLGVCGWRAKTRERSTAPPQA